MTKMTRLLACISSHGYGHFAMTAPILNALNQQRSISLTVRCALPETLIRSRIDGDFEIVAESSDFGILMNSSLDVDLENSAIAYQALHENFSQAVVEEKTRLLDFKPDLILANIPYLTIAAAAQAGIPVIAYCSLNWAEIFNHYFAKTLRNAQKIFDEMNAAYNAAECFICPAPSMAMPGLSNIKHVGPVARIASPRKQWICEKLSLPANTKLVLITPGGVQTPVPVNDWPVLPGIVWVAAWPYKSEREDIISIEQNPVSFTELLASCDAVMTKPGYGTVAETTCNGVPALYVLRGDWPEEPFLTAWWSRHGTVLRISRENFFSGNARESLRELWQMPSPRPVAATGLKEILSLLAPYLALD